MSTIDGLLARVSELHEEAAAKIAAATTTTELDELRIAVLGRKAELPNLLRGVSELPPADRGRAGKAANVARTQIESLLTERTQAARRRRGGRSAVGRSPRPHAARYTTAARWRAARDHEHVA